VPADKDAAKRRRQARNRQERNNRQARTEGAKRAASRPSRTAEETPDRSTKGAGKTSLAKTPATPAAPGGFLGKLFPPRPEPVAKGADGRPARTAGRQPRPPSEVVEVEGASGPRGLLVTLTSQPGGRAAVLALLVAVVSGISLFVLPVAPPAVLARYGAMVVVQADGGDATETGAVDDAQDEFADADPVVADYSVTLLDLLPAPAALVYALIPVALTGVAVRSLTRPTRSRTLMICSIAGVAYVVLGGPIGVFFFLGVIALGFAAYQSSKADRAALAASS
jgi:hypothetical protein